MYYDNTRARPRIRGYIHACAFIVVLYSSPYMVDVCNNYTQIILSVMFLSSHALSMMCSALYHIMSTTLKREIFLSHADMIAIILVCGCNLLPALYVNIYACVCCCVLLCVAIINYLYCIVNISHEYIALVFIFLTVPAFIYSYYNITYVILLLACDAVIYTAGGIAFKYRDVVINEYFYIHEVFHILTVCGFVCTYIINYLCIVAQKN